MNDICLTSIVYFNYLPFISKYYLFALAFCVEIFPKIATSGKL